MNSRRTALDKCRPHRGVTLPANGPPRLRELIQEQRNLPKLMDLKEQVAVHSGTLAYTFEQIKKRQAWDKKSSISAREMNTIVTLSGRISRTVESFARVEGATKSLIHIDTFDRFLGELMCIAGEFMSPDKVKKFGERFAARASEIAMEDGEKKPRRRWKIY